MPGKKRGFFLLPLIITIAVVLAIWGGQQLTVAVGGSVYAPSPPTGLAVTDPGTGEFLVLRWNPSPDAETQEITYRIYRAVSDNVYGPTDGSYKFLDETPETTYTDTTVSRDVYYFYRVTAVDQDDNESSPSAPASTTATDVTAPETPQSFRAVELDTGHDVELRWEANRESDLAGYQLYRATEPQGPFELEIIGPGETSFRDSGLAQGQSYYYYMIALDEDGNASGPTSIVSVRPRQAVRAEFDEPDARTPAHLFIQPDCSAVFLNVPGDRILVRARAIDESGDPVPLAGTIRFAAAFGEFRHPVVTGANTAEATFTADELGEGEIAVEYYPPGAEQPTVVDTTIVRALEWHIALSASGNQTTTGADDITLSVSVTDQSGRPVTDWQAQVVFETMTSPAVEKGKDKDKRHPGRWHGRAHANIVKNGQKSGVSAGRPDENGQIEAQWVASTVPGTTRVRAVLYYDDLRGPESPPKRVEASNSCRVEVEPGPARYVGFEPGSIPSTGKKHRVSVRAFDAFGNATEDWDDLKIQVQVPRGVPAVFSSDNGKTWHEPETWVPVEPNADLLVRLTGKDLPGDLCILTTQAEGTALEPPPGVPQVNLPLRVEKGKEK
ncbi:MAG: hypothetical protein AB1330_08070 [Bacillota bacterium]